MSHFMLAGGDVLSQAVFPQRKLVWKVLLMSKMTAQVAGNFSLHVLLRIVGRSREGGMPVVLQKSATQFDQRFPSAHDKHASIDLQPHVPLFFLASRARALMAKALFAEKHLYSFLC